MKTVPCGGLCPAWQDLEKRGQFKGKVLPMAPKDSLRGSKPASVSALCALPVIDCLERATGRQPPASRSLTSPPASTETHSAVHAVGA